MTAARMIHESILWSGVRTRAVAWLSIIGLMSAVSSTVSEDVTLHTTPPLVARCGENVTLTCDASMPQRLEIIKFYWVGRNKTLCQVEKEKHDPEVACEYAAEATDHRLTLTLINVTVVQKEKFICKLYSRKGDMSNSTYVTVRGCFSKGHALNESLASCWFRGDSAAGEIHWSRGSTNLTHFASTLKHVDQRGSYNITSTLSIQEGNHPYTCSLWVPDLRRYLAQQQLLMETTSSGRMVTPQWICLMVVIVKCTM